MNNRLALAVCVVAALTCAGCAGTAPKAMFTQELVAEQRLSAVDTPEYKLSVVDGVAMLDMEKERVLQQIQSQVKAKQAMNSVSGEPRNLRIDVVMTRYQKGNSFARAMLAGLGQMHIDAQVSVYQVPENNRLTEFKVSKTFAWGGIYGAATRIEDIEQAFAEGIAAALTGQADESEKKQQQKQT